MHNVASLNGRIAVLQPLTPSCFAKRWQAAFRLLEDGAPAAIAVGPAPVHPYWSYRVEEGGALTPILS